MVRSREKEFLKYNQIQVQIIYFTDENQLTEK